MDSRYVVIEFLGGPLDGFHNGWTTDQSVILPEMLASFNKGWSYGGTYHIRVRGIGHYVYQWREAAP